MDQTMIEWNKVSKEDSEIISKCIKRAVKMKLAIGGNDTLDMSMDVTAAHLAQPLKLQALLEADNSNFGHDICGIQRHIDRETGKMLNFFLPRFTASSAEQRITRLGCKKHSTLKPKTCVTCAIAASENKANQANK